MPLYEYRCKKCSLRFEQRRSFEESGKAVCPSCGSEAQRLFLPVAIVFKGSGFYTTDYRPKEDVKPDNVDDKKATPNAS